MIDLNVILDLDSQSIPGTLSGFDEVFNFEHVNGPGGDQLHLQTPPSNFWAYGWVQTEVMGDTVFQLRAHHVSSDILAAQVIVHGVTGLVQGDDYVIF